mgnify:CR=1 FL=1
MKSKLKQYLYRPFLAILGVASLMVIASCGDESLSPQSSTTGAITDDDTIVAKSVAQLSSLPRKGKVRAAVPPKYAVFGMRWLNTAENREYIFDGAQFVPHDNTVEDFYRAKEQKAKKTDKTVALTQDQVCEDGDDCTPTGAHAKHGAYACSVCHKVAGRLVFDKNGPAYPQPYNAANPKPTFNATAKTCSNTACHTVPSGIFGYYFPGNDDNDGDGYPDPELKEVPYGGSPGQSNANWNVPGQSCSACHDNPPKYNNVPYLWHSGYHGNNTNYNYGGTIINSNACELCHNVQVGSTFYPIAASENGVGTSILNPAHSNGTLNVVARFKSQCFGCH